MPRAECTCTPAHRAFWLSRYISARKNVILGASVRQVQLISLMQIPSSLRALTHSPPLVPCPQDRPVAASAPLRQWGIKASAGAGERVILCNAHSQCGAIRERQRGRCACSPLAGRTEAMKMIWLWSLRTKAVFHSYSTTLTPMAASLLI